MAGTGELFIHEHNLNLYALAKDLAEEDSKLSDILREEDILNVVTSKLNRSKMTMKVYVFTDFATLISFTYNFQKGESRTVKNTTSGMKESQSRFESLKYHSIRNLSISDHLKQMTVFKLSKIIATEQYPV
jgi:hypothetical protein